MTSHNAAHVDAVDIEWIPGAVLVTDGNRRITAASSGVTRITGLPRVEIINVDVGELLQPTSIDGHRVLLDGWDRSAKLSSIVRFAPQSIGVRGAGGHRLTVRVTGSYQRSITGEITGAIICLERPDAARRADRSIEIISTVSHELRSPLTSVKGYTSLLLNRWDRLRDDQKKMMLESVHHDADRVTRLVTELLDISRLETGRLVLRRQSVDLAPLVNSVVDKVAMLYPDLDATVEFDPAVPKVFADSDKIEQVLTNLVENACKYASPRGVRIEGSRRGDEVCVAVSDQGEGISAEDLPRVFTRFFRRGDARPSGSGLGLWISRGLVESHGGRLSAESNPPDGAVFRFTLPIEPPDRQE